MRAYRGRKRRFLCLFLHPCRSPVFSVSNSKVGTVER
nr:MAG TPA: hypothetical protein [Caudoviricetes sp.]